MKMNNLKNQKENTIFFLYFLFADGMSAGQKLGRRRKVEERVDISDLQFGEDFQDAEAMLNAEVKVRIIHTLITL
jgi:hypothetical protein